MTHFEGTGKPRGNFRATCDETPQIAKFSPR